MTQFDIRGATGKAGEREVERFIENQLGYVYRKIDSTDLGVDGEIEILDRRRGATGGLIKVQVKSTRAAVTGSRIRVALDESHLDYYASLTVPVILAYVSMADGQIWWRPIHHKSRHRGPKGGFVVTLNAKSDRLTRSSATLLSFIGNFSNATMAKSLVEVAVEALDDIDRHREEQNYDFCTLDIWAEEIAEMEKDLAEATCLLKYERRYTAQISGIEEANDEARTRVSDLKAWFRHIGYGDILDERLGRNRLDD